MRINEDFIDQDDNLEQMTNQDVSIENPEFIMQDRRPVVELLREWDSILYLEIGDYWNNQPDYPKHVEQMVVKYTRKLRDVLERLPYRVEMSQFVVGSGMNDGEWEHDDTNGFSQYKTYLLNQTEDDRGIQKETKLFLGIRLPQREINLQKTFVALSQISKIIFKITNVPGFIILYNESHLKIWNDFHIYSGRTVGNEMKKRLEKDIEDASVDEEPNYYGIDVWMDMLCILSGHSCKEIKIMDYQFTVEQIRKFREMLRTKNI